MDRIIKKFFTELKDPRIHHKKILHNFKDIIIMAILAVIGGSQGWEEIEIWCLNKKKLISELLKTTLIPSHDTFRRVFSLLDAKKFEQNFTKFMQFLTHKKSNMIKDIIAIDGKSLRGSKRNAINKSPLHIVNAWSSQHGLFLGQTRVDSNKSNEIKAIPELLELLNIKNNIITIDAMGTQKKIASKIIKEGGDYMLALKANHKSAFHQINNYFKQHVFATGSGEFPYQDKFEGDSHGRIERRRYFIKPATSFPLLSQWESIKFVIAVERIRGLKNTEKVSSEIHYYITSAEDSPQFLATCIRNHWSIENNLHWSLDVVFREDSNRTTNENAALNLSLVRKLALNILKNDKTYKKSIPLKRKQACLNDDYLKTLLQL